MRYTVVCHPRPEAELAQLWMRARDRGAIARSAAAIDRFLEQTPEQGQPAGDYYLWVEESLVVRYRFSPDDCLVEILGYELNLSGPIDFILISVVEPSNLPSLCTLGHGSG